MINIENITEGEEKTIKLLKEKYAFSDEKITQMLLANREADKDKAIEDEKFKNITKLKSVKTHTEIGEFEDWLEQKEKDEESF